MQEKLEFFFYIFFKRLPKVSPPSECFYNYINNKFVSFLQIELEIKPLKEIEIIHTLDSLINAHCTVGLRIYIPSAALFHSMY
jgi:hypothetical protein